MAASVALMVLAVGDPTAALIGRRFGRIRLVHGRSLEGSLAFFGAGVLMALAGLLIYYPMLSWWTLAALAGFGALCGAVAELFSRRIDDNLSIPVSAAGGVWLMMLFLGL